VGAPSDACRAPRCAIVDKDAIRRKRRRIFIVVPVPNVDDPV
jgi:hypothetical protein